jgi:hypothetical protein
MALPAALTFRRSVIAARHVEADRITVVDVVKSPPR